MSILDRLNGHLDDRALAAIWTDASIDRAQPAHPHLESCAECRTRLAAFSSWLDDLRTDANAEADEAFPAERLAAQQAQILRRLESAGRPARVIAFPRFAQPISATTSNARRWVSRVRPIATSVARCGRSTCGVVTSVRTPSAYRARRASSDSATEAAPSSTPGTRWL